MKKLYAPFLQQLWSVNGNAPILPEHLLAKYNDDKGSFNTAPYNALPIGSGPFKVVAWHRGQDVEMVANPNFYLGAPKLKQVIYKILPDENTVATQLQTHELDMLAMGSGLKWPEYAAMAADPKNGLKADSGRRVRLGARRFQPPPSHRLRRAGTPGDRIRERSQRDHSKGRARLGDSRLHRPAAALFVGIHGRRRALSVRPR